jgi:hypothetical protein
LYASYVAVKMMCVCFIKRKKEPNKGRETISLYFTGNKLFFFFFFFFAVVGFELRALGLMGRPNIFKSKSVLVLSTMNFKIRIAPLLVLHTALTNLTMKRNLRHLSSSLSLWTKAARSVVHYSIQFLSNASLNYTPTITAKSNTSYMTFWVALRKLRMRSQHRSTQYKMS